MSYRFFLLYQGRIILFANTQLFLLTTELMYKQVCKFKDELHYTKRFSNQSLVGARGIWNCMYIIFEKNGWDWKGKLFTVTLAMRLRNLQSSSCAVESKGWECINVYKLCINLLSPVRWRVGTAKEEALLWPLLWDCETYSLHSIESKGRSA